MKPFSLSDILMWWWFNDFVWLLRILLYTECSYKLGSIRVFLQKKSYAYINVSDWLF